MRLGLSTRVNLLIYAPITAMLLAYVPAIRAYLDMRSVLVEMRADLYQRLLLRQFDSLAVRQAVEYLDVVVLEESPSELEETRRAARAVLARLRRGAGAEHEEGELERLERLAATHGRLERIGEQAVGLVRRGERESAARLIGESMEIHRDEELSALIEEALIEESIAFDEGLERLLTTTGQFLFVPFMDIESGAGRLRAHATEAIAAAALSQHFHRLVAEYQDFAFLGNAWHQVYLADGKTERAYRSWQAQAGTASTSEPSVPADHVFQIGGHYRELKQLGRKLVQLRDADTQAALLSTYESELEPLAERSFKLSDDAFEAYSAHLDAGIRAVSGRVLLAGWTIAFFILVALGLALGSPWLMSRWIVQPLLALTRATEKLGAGDLSQRVEMTSRDELGDLAAGFNQMAVDLKEAQERLSRRERLVVLGQLAGSVGHEIRNPLAAMKSSIYFLRRFGKVKDETVGQHLGIIDHQIERANRIVTELLDYARGATAERKRFPLPEIVESALATVDVPDTVHLEHRCGTGPLTVEVDPGQIERLLANLVLNAVQAMSGGGELTVACHRRGDEAIVEVADTGVGIAEEDLAKIFEPLYTSKSQGIGLGLPLSQRYAELNEGRIECESEISRGTTFRLVLPVVRADL